VPNLVPIWSIFLQLQLFGLSPVGTQFSWRTDGRTYAPNVANTGLCCNLGHFVHPYVAWSQMAWSRGYWPPSFLLRYLQDEPKNRTLVTFSNDSNNPGSLSRNFATKKLSFNKHYLGTCYFVWNFKNRVPAEVFPRHPQCIGNCTVIPNSIDQYYLVILQRNDVSHEILSRDCNVNKLLISDIVVRSYNKCSNWCLFTRT